MAKTTTNPFEPKNSEENMLTNAIIWALGEHKEENCPFCSWAPQAGASEDSLPRHVRERHPFKVVVAHQSKTLDPIIRDPDEGTVNGENDFLKAAGINSVEDLDRPNYLFIPIELRKEIESRGGKTRWVRGKNRLEQCLSAGAKLVDRQGHEMPYQHSKEDSSVRSNELFLIEWPKEVAERRRKRVEARADNNLVARAEQVRKTQDAQEKHIYDTMIALNYDRSTAAQVSRALASKGGNWQKGSPNRHQGIEIRDRRGTVSL